jgi:ADP-ribose pyrophosphatase YjhB (NUDIX family)
VFNHNKEILMIKHNKLKVWLPPGGHINENELPEDAVLREVLEETGIRASIISFKQNLSLSDDACRELERPFAVLLEDIENDGIHNHIDMVYLCIATNDELQLQMSEASEAGWFSYEQFKQLETFENVSKTVSRAVDHVRDNMAMA